MLPFTLIAGSVWGHTTGSLAVGTSSLVEPPAAAGFTGGWGDWLSGGCSPREQRSGGGWALCGLPAHQSLPTACNRQDRAACAWGRGGKEADLSCTFSLRHLTWARSQIHQFSAAVVFNGHIASFLTDLPLFVPASPPFTSGCCVFRASTRPSASWFLRRVAGRAAGSASRPFAPAGRVASGSSELLSPPWQRGQCLIPRLATAFNLITTGSSKGQGSWGFAPFTSFLAVLAERGHQSNKGQEAGWPLAWTSHREPKAQPFFKTSSPKVLPAGAAQALAARRSVF